MRLGLNMSITGAGSVSLSAELWILFTGLWSDDKYWLDNAEWNDSTELWILFTGLWSDGKYWLDNAEWNDGA